MDVVTHVSMLEKLPPVYPDDLTEAINSAIAASGTKVVALDDDPTGVQTVADIPVLARWTVADLAAELLNPYPLCFILTNSRSLPEDQAVSINREIAASLLEASARTGVGVVIASRSDSTLRGHYPAETDALAEELGGVDGVLIVPAFFEGGRVTIADVHYVRDEDRLVPAAETEFARDPSFGYTASNLRDWVAEKSSSRVSAEDVLSLGLDEIRRGGPETVERALGLVTDGRPVVVNAADERDLQVVALGVIMAERAGKRFLYRTGASFVRARAGLAPRPLLTRDELVGIGAASPLPGLVVVGSHVRRSSEQLAHLLALPDVDPVELSVSLVLDAATRDTETSRARDAVDASLSASRIPVLFTSREVRFADNVIAQLAVSRSVSAALVGVAGGLSRSEDKPGWVVGKGGITSSDIGTVALGARRAMVLGQILPGVPVWRLGEETRYPGLPYVVFPGNVGGPQSLVEVVRLLSGMTS